MRINVTASIHREKPRLGTDPFAIVDDFIEEVAAAVTHQDVFDIVLRHVQKMGFEHCTYEVMVSPDGTQSPFYFTNYPMEWIGHYIHNSYSSDDLVCREAAQSIRPFLWASLKKDLPLTVQQARVFDEGSDAGLKAGASIPLHGPGNAKAYFVVSNNVDDAAFASEFIRHQHSLRLIAVYAHDRFMALGIPGNAAPAHLTPREIEVMKWSARGKSMWDIAGILAISEHTVKSHLDNVFGKLGVHNKTHAIAIAVTQGLVVL